MLPIQKAPLVWEKKPDNGISDDLTSSNFSDNLWSNTPLPDLSSSLAQ